MEMVEENPLWQKDLGPCCAPSAPSSPWAVIPRRDLPAWCRQILSCCPIVPLPWSEELGPCLDCSGTEAVYFREELTCFMFIRDVICCR